ncbi:TPA: hypothetical protein ACHWKL_003092 [Providencia stuartii]|uniref:hypothetical protein n=1 Tax=Providencia stuartii TaxID=588 RepID=UPI0013744034|nr:MULTISPECIES: hypothetical protein [Providencia]MCL8325138.1 hypothetical protein [Providencia thailandensis]MDF4174002.1 hypothetical protein [Providencia thailandensis]WIJ74766.1 hypothetical protein OI982_04500 [Providencia thailandensis]CAK6613996.1 Phage portal protein [Providencia stuartii]CAK6615240.1 Phage portal protein [Providencia stuartii]
MLITEKAVITFYKIHRAGFYKSGASIPAFGSTNEMLNELVGWAEGKKLKQTKTFEANDEMYPSYLLDSYTDGNQWMLLLWNEVPTNGQRLPSISESATFGSDPEVIMNEVANGSIPGYATYFWILPEEGMYATIKLHNKLTGQQSFQNYLSCFLKQSSPHAICSEVVDEDGNKGIKVVGYKSDPDDENEKAAHYYPMFKASMVKNPGNIDYIRASAERLVKIERITELDVSIPKDLELWQKMLIKLGISQRSPVAPESTKIRYTVSPDVDLVGINQMIEEWYSQDNQYDDFGFYFKNESDKPYWLSKSLARTEFSLNLVRENAEIVNLNSLLSELSRLKPQILGNAGIS